MLEVIKKNKNFILFTIGMILIFLSFALLYYDSYEYIKNGIFTDIALAKYNESQLNNNVDNTFESDGSDDNQSVDVDTDYIINSEDEENNSDENNNSNRVPESEYIGFLEIDKINLRVGLVSKNSVYNNVNKNVEILDQSDYPNVLNGNFILASHSGTSKISYFKDLYKLSLNDVASVYYKDYVYQYKIVDIYDVPKVGTLEVRRDSEKTVMTLITCTRGSEKLQTVYILELFSKIKSGELND